VGTIASRTFKSYPAKRNRLHACELVGRGAGFSSALHAQWPKGESLKRVTATPSAWPRSRAFSLDGSWRKMEVNPWPYEMLCPVEVFGSRKSYVAGDTVVDGADVRSKWQCSYLRRSGGG